MILLLIKYININIYTFILHFSHCKSGNGKLQTIHESLLGISTFSPPRYGNTDTLILHLNVPYNELVCVCL